MRTYGRVHTAFWTDEKMQGLSERAKLLALYLLTGPHTNHLGCFRLPEGYIMADFGWDAATVRETLSETLSVGFIERDQNTGWTLVRHYLKFNPIENPNVAKSLLSLVDAVPKNINVYSALLRAMQPYRERFGKGFPQPYAKHGDGDGDGNGEVVQPFGCDPPEAEVPVLDEPDDVPEGKRVTTLEALKVEAGETKLATVLGVDAHAELPRFKDYCRSRGKSFKDYRAAFRNWLRSEAKWLKDKKPNGAGAAGKSVPRQTNNRTLEEIERDGIDLYAPLERRRA